ncbi:MAG TPA: type II toxin-antitoxin system HicA family toxin [Saprospiraceae bacterium]|nr:type II toxin-antitoxin system HicA family toxin [Saprospiraceae bacterium]
MSSKEKLKQRFLTMPKNFHYNEMVKLLGDFGYQELKIGKTSGSRVKFVNEVGDQIRMHKPHPTGILKAYQLKEIKDKLGL